MAEDFSIDVRIEIDRESFVRAAEALAAMPGGTVEVIATTSPAVDATVATIHAVAVEDFEDPDGRQCQRDAAGRTRSWFVPVPGDGEAGWTPWTDPAQAA